MEVEPNVVVFPAPFNATRSAHQLKNVGQTRLTTKIKVTHPDCILANPVFALVEPGQSVKLSIHGRFNENPDPKQSYRVYVVYVDATAEMNPTDDAPKLKQAWQSIKDTKTIKMNVEFSPPLTTEQLPPSPATPEAAPAEAAPAEAE